MITPSFRHYRLSNYVSPRCIWRNFKSSNATCAILRAHLKLGCRIKVHYILCCNSHSLWDQMGYVLVPSN
jgi:hypothetical protein